MRIHHVQVTIPPGEEVAARAFFVGVLGLAEVAKPPSLAGRGGFWLEVGDQQLHVGVEERAPGSHTKAHVAFEVDDVAAWRGRVAGAGLTIGDSVPIPGYDRFEFRDPWGNRFELIAAQHASTERFTRRVDDYARYRPGYPPELVALLAQETGLAPGSAVADVGSGTGLLTALLLGAGHRVFAVEPNAAMRSAAEATLGGNVGFVSVDGTAEATGLPDGAVHLVTAAQAFHWFDPAGAAREFQRILQPPGWAAMIWNERSAQDNAFLADYNAMLERHCPDYSYVEHRAESNEGLDVLYGPAGWRTFTLPNGQHLDRAGLHGRVMSSSYAPLPGDRGHAAFVAAIDELFDAYAEAGTVTIPYTTRVYLGHVRAPRSGST